MNETTISSDTSPKLAKVMELARKDPGLRLRSLAHVLDEDLLRRSFHQLRKDAAIGVDEVTKERYGLNLADNIRGLHERMKHTRYRHQPIRRVYIAESERGATPAGDFVHRGQGRAEGADGAAERDLRAGVHELLVRIPSGP